MSNKTHTIYAVFALWIFISPVHGVEQGLRVEIQDSVITNFKAPGLLTGAFLVSNLDTFARDVFEDLQLPDNWQLVTKDVLFSLGPGLHTVRITGIHVPASTLPSKYTLTYRVRDLNHPECGDQHSLFVEVRPIVAIDLFVRHAPPRVEAGSNYSVEFEIIHRGNSAAQFDLSALSTSGFRVKLDSGQVNLLPGESRQIGATISTTRQILHAIKDRLIFEATSTQDSLISRWKSYTTIDVLPGSGAIPNRYREFPSRIKASYIGGEGVNGMQYEYSGAGFIDERERYRLEYHYRGPRNMERSVYGIRDEYCLNLKSKVGELGAGDQSFTLSNLLERSRLGRGISGKYERQSLEVGVIGFRSRPQYPDLEEFGGYIGGHISHRFTIRGNVLDKKTSQSHDQLFSVSSSIKPNSSWKANIEYASSARDSSYRKVPQAFAGRIDGRINGIIISLQMQHADREFAGYLQDEEQNFIDLYAPLPANFGWTFSYRTLAQNLELTETKSSATRERHVRTGIRYRNPILLSGSLDVEDHERIDKLSAPDYDNRAMFTVARLQKSIRLLSFSSAIVRGYRKDYLTDRTRDHESYRVGIDLRPSSTQNYSIWCQSGHSGYSIEARRSRILGMALGYRVIRRMRIIGNFQARDQNNCGEFESLQYDFSIQYEPFQNHILLFKIRRLDLDELQIDSEYSYLLSYEIPFGVPIARKRTLGAVRGKICEVNGEKHTGIPGVVLRMGNRVALSNKNGTFAFHSIEQGTQYLQIDNAGIGLDRLTKQLLPIEVQVQGGETETLNLDVVVSGSIAGDLALYGLADFSTSRGLLLEQSTDTSSSLSDQELIRLRGLSDIPLTLTSENEVIHTLTDKNGWFAVTKLRPGIWTIEVTSYGLPPYHEFGNIPYEVNLQPDQHEVIELKVVPQVRRLVIVDSKTLRLSMNEAENISTPRISQEKNVSSKTYSPLIEAKQTIAYSDIDSNGSWYVQVGAFRNRNYADRRADILRSAGYDTRFVPLETSSGIIRQIRIPGFANKHTADSVSAVLNETLGFSTLVITSRHPTGEYPTQFNRRLTRAEEVTKAPLLVEAQMNENACWYIQVGAFRSPNNVDRIVNRLKRANIPYKLVPSIADSTLMQVRIGGFDTKSKSSTIASQIDIWLGTQTLVIREK